MDTQLRYTAGLQASHVAAPLIQVHAQQKKKKKTQAWCNRPAPPTLFSVFILLFKNGQDFLLMFFVLTVSRG